ncbi:MAG: carboxylesterase family protein [Oscillospiraceae bacterium]|nr:carboxylesterase family protein [Oscillospiraceae bacterium]
MIRIADTENGKVRGLPAADPRVTSFKGIPFAAPPIGENRWRAPQPCKNWDGILDAYTFAPISMQDVPGLGTDIYCREWHVDPEIPMSEDCLYLNVWTNAKSTADSLPVLVWFFGGGYQWGYTSEMEFDGERLARQGVVVVTVNYRLGAFGFLAHPELSAAQPDAPCNFGSLDQQEGLRWVKRNIASFGGDPNNITIAGQSAGGGSVLAQMACKANEGDFNKAVIFSGMFRSPYEPNPFFIPRSLEQAGKLGEEFFSFMGISSLEEARKLDARFIRDKYSEFRGAKNVMFCIVRDGKFCTGDAMKAFYSGERIRVPVMAGNTEDEFVDGISAENIDDLRNKAKKYFGNNADKFLSFNEAVNKTACGYAAVSHPEIGVKSAFISESRLECPRDCYYYRFMPDIPGDDHPGTFHSVDLWFFFETLAKCTRPYSGRHYDLARQMSSYWINFIKTGDPNGMDSNGEPLPHWDNYTDKNRAEMLFTSDGAKPAENESGFASFLINETMVRENGGAAK